MGKIASMIGNASSELVARKAETPAQQGVSMERKTGFEPATLTLARI
jgi:hypothetical protein